jgi:peptide-methionine (S)-S-oxide reductase
VELAYQRTPGVTRTSVGYCNGHTVNPTYEQTCTGRTGHTEAVLVEFDPALTSYQKLVEVLCVAARSCLLSALTSAPSWSKIDPTQIEGQGNDHGSQYRCDSKS